MRCRGRGKLAVSWGWDILGWHCEQGEACGEAAHVSVALTLCQGLALTCKADGSACGLVYGALGKAEEGRPGSHKWGLMGVMWGLGLCLECGC